MGMRFFYLLALIVIVLAVCSDGQRRRRRRRSTRSPYTTRRTYTTRRAVTRRPTHRAKVGHDDLPHCTERDCNLWFSACKRTCGVCDLGAKEDEPPYQRSVRMPGQM